MNYIGRDSRYNSWIHKIKLIHERRIFLTKRKVDDKYKRNTIITLRLTDMELAVLDKACDNTGLSRSDYLRSLIMQRTPKIHFEVIADIDVIKKLVGEYGKIGSNLNQIAKYFNAGGERSLMIEDEIRQCISDLFVLRKDVLRLVGDWNGNT